MAEGHERRKGYDPAERRETYLFFKARGICAVCTKNKAEPGRVLCAGCRERDRVNSANRYRDGGGARAKERYRENRNAGKCGVCGKRDAEPGRARCAECAAAQRYSQRKCYNSEAAKERYRENRNAGKCGVCGKRDAEPGRARCAECAAVLRVSQKRYWKKKKARGQSGTDGAAEAARGGGEGLDM